MTNIERAIERLNDVMYLREINYAGEQVTAPTVNLNDYRAEIVALMRWLMPHDYKSCSCCTPMYGAHTRDCPLAALAAKILGEQG